MMEEYHRIRRQMLLSYIRRLIIMRDVNETNTKCLYQCLITLYRYVYWHFLIFLDNGIDIVVRSGAAPLGYSYTSNLLIIFVFNIYLSSYFVACIYRNRLKHIIHKGGQRYVSALLHCF